MGMSKDPEKRARQLANLKSCKKGEQPPGAGRKPNTLRSVIDEMVRTGYAIPTKEEMRDGLIVCAFGNEAQIKGLVTDVTKPMALRVIAKQVLSGNGFDAIEKILDRVVGKILDVQTNGKDIVKPDPVIVQVIDNASEVIQQEEE